MLLSFVYSAMCVVVSTFSPYSSNPHSLIHSHSLTLAHTHTHTYTSQIHVANSTNRKERNSPHATILVRITCFPRCCFVFIHLFLYRLLCLGCVLKCMRTSTINVQRIIFHIFHGPNRFYRYIPQYMHSATIFLRLFLCELVVFIGCSHWLNVIIPKWYCTP